MNPAFGLSIETATLEQLREAEAVRESNVLQFALELKNERRRLALLRKHIRKHTPQEPES